VSIAKGKKNKKSILVDGIHFKIKTNTLFKSTFHCLIVWSINIEEFYKELEKDVEISLYNEDYLSSISANRINIVIKQDDEYKSNSKMIRKMTVFISFKKNKFTD
jgi:hypothetical protein